MTTHATRSLPLKLSLMPRHKQRGTAYPMPYATAATSIATDFIDLMENDHAL